MDHPAAKCIQEMLHSSKKHSKKRRLKKKPKTFLVEESSVLERVKQFLPEIEAANKELPEPTIEDGNPTSIVDFESASDASRSETDESGDSDGDDEEVQRAGPAKVEMNLALYQYSSSDSDSECEAGSHLSDDKVESDSSDSTIESNDNNGVVTKENLRLRKSENERRPKIEEIPKNDSS